MLRLGALWQRRPIFGADLEVVVDGDTEKRLTGWEGRGVMLTPVGLVLAISVGVTDLRHRLPIGPSYDDFLARLGGHTRRNVRNSMRDGGRNGFTWCIEKAPDPRWPALLALGRHGHPEPYDGATIDRVKRLVTFLGDPFWAFLIVPDACGILAQATRERFRALCQGALHGTRLAAFGACAAGARGPTEKAAPRR